MIGDLLLLAEIAGRIVALPAADVASVNELEKATPVPGAPAWIVGIGTQRSRALTIIDARMALGVGNAGEGVEHDSRYVIFAYEDHHYALRCDRILDVMPSHSDVERMPKGLGSEWMSAATGVVETPVGAALLLDLGACVAGPDRLAA